MGQYYKPLAMRDHGNPVIGWLLSHDYDNGLKLMEHSYLANGFVQTVESLLIPGGDWYKKQIVWAGDYADAEPGLNEKTGGNLYSLCTDKTKLNPAEVDINQKDYPYIVNHTKKLYVDKNKVPGGKPGWEEYHIHPLPLLTCEGNGGGGGDFFGEDPKGLIGSWARNSISIESTIPEGYTELVFDLVE